MQYSSLLKWRQNPITSGSVLTLPSDERKGRVMGTDHEGLPTLQTLPNVNASKSFTCNHVFPEMTALCPVTKLPDFYRIHLLYAPDKKLVELKSLKLYFVAFRNLEILHEELTNRVLDDFIHAVRPKWARIEVLVNNRGGIDTVITRLWKRGTENTIRLPSC